MRGTTVVRDFLLLFTAGLVVATVFLVAGHVRAAQGATFRHSTAFYRYQWLEGRERRAELRGTARKLRTENRRLRVRHTRDLTYYLRLGADLFHVDQGLLGRVIYCESHNYQYAKNRSSTASGYGQWLDSTWRSSGLPRFSVFDGLANVLATARLISEGGLSHWNASRRCWS